MSEEWVRVADRKDVTDGMPLQAEVGGELVCLYEVEGAVYATADICTHAFACLSEGFQDGDMIECPLHEGRFHIPTGKAQGDPVTEDSAVWSVKVEDGGVFVKPPAA